MFVTFIFTSNFYSICLFFVNFFNWILQSLYFLWLFILLSTFFSFFLSSKIFSNLGFFACDFENVMENFLAWYFRYSYLTRSSRMFSFSRRSKQVDMCSFIFSTNSLFKVKELLKVHEPFPLAIIFDPLWVKDIGEWLVERDAISYVSIVYWLS